MILRGIQIQRCGHDRCGLLSDHAFPGNLAEFSPSGVCGLIRMSPCDGVISPFIATSTLGGPTRVRL